MVNWTEDELNKIGSATEVQLCSLRSDGTYRNPVTIWIVRMGSNLYIRAVSGVNGKWYKHTIEENEGRITASGKEKDVYFEEYKGDQIPIDEVYKSKYESFGYSIIETTLTTQAKAATLKVSPK